MKKKVKHNKKADVHTGMLFERSLVRRRESPEIRPAPAQGGSLFSGRAHQKLASLLMLLLLAYDTYSVSWGHWPGGVTGLSKIYFTRSRGM